MKRICGAMTLKGTPCQWDLGKCDYHSPAEPEERSLQLIRATPEAMPPLQPPEPTPPGLAERDIHRLAWWLFEEVTGEMETTKARVLTSILHLLESLGPAGMERDERFGEVAHVGKLSLGIQPADNAEWEWVQERFEQDAIDEFHRWPLLQDQELTIDRRDRDFKHR
jgi:hypothetical protein